MVIISARAYRSFDAILRQRMKASACEIEFDLIVVADARKSEQLEHEFAQPSRVLRGNKQSRHGNAQPAPSTS